MDAVTDLDRRQAERVAQLKRGRAVAGEGQGAAGKAPAADTTAQPAFRKGERWIAFNTFMDVIAPRLTLAERAVWLVMFRHARGGVCETTVRMLATAANVSISTAQAAMNRLHDVGLVRPIWKSKDRAKASKYRIHHRPADCLNRLTQHPETVPMIGTVADTNRTD